MAASASSNSASALAIDAEVVVNIRDPGRSQVLAAIGAKEADPAEGLARVGARAANSNTYRPVAQFTPLQDLHT